MGKSDPGCSSLTMSEFCCHPSAISGSCGKSILSRPSRCMTGRLALCTQCLVSPNTLYELLHLVCGVDDQTSSLCEVDYIADVQALGRLICFCLKVGLDEIPMKDCQTMCGIDVQKCTKHLHSSSKLTHLNSHYFLQLLLPDQDSPWCLWLQAFWHGFGSCAVMRGCQGVEWQASADSSLSALASVLHWNSLASPRSNSTYS